MSLNRMFELVDGARTAASWQAAFGDPQQIEGKTVIPVAQVGYGFGLGFGQGGERTEPQPEPSSAGEGGGGGGGAMSKPLGVIVVAPDGVRFEPVASGTIVPLAGMAVGALFLWQLAKTLQVIFGRS
jgi:uncharacterized spore protein YtfJ